MVTSIKPESMFGHDYIFRLKNFKINRLSLWHKNGLFRDMVL